MRLVKRRLRKYRLERLLSLYDPTSELSGINAHASDRAVSVSGTVMRVLMEARRIWELTDGAFDITVAPLMRCWRLAGRLGKPPTDAEVGAALGVVGMDLVALDAAAGTVRFARPGVMLDLGAIGKGFAIDRAVEMLRDAGIVSGLLHGGSSTVYGIGAPPGAAGWRVGIEPERAEDGGPFGVVACDAPLWLGTTKYAKHTKEKEPAGVVLRDQSLSVSAPHGRWFDAVGRKYGHVIDARTGQPVAGLRAAGVVSSSATESDALSTALLVGGADLIERLGTAVQVGGFTVSTVSNGSGEVVRFGSRYLTI